ncbi:MAG: gliding motility protein GldL [Bacteroidales bacterium]|nr:gliding motility protein GldL [Bacteroidales bacterium]
MSISELVETEGYKKFMAKVYGWGAAIVLLGALFKIQHYPGASIMLVVGLSTEALIFFFSAFEPLHQELDWTLVYPELAGLDEIEEEIQPSGRKSSVSQQDGTALQKFDEMLEQGKLGPELFEKLGSSLEALNTNVMSMGTISNAAVATESYVTNVGKAATSADAIAASFNTSAQKVSDSVDSIVVTTKTAADAIISSGQKTSEIITKSAQNTAAIVDNAGASYQSLLQGLNANFASIGENSKGQAQQQEALTKNLAALNAVYELQLKNSTTNMEATEKITGGINSIMSDLKSTAADVSKYKNEISKLSQNLSALNTVYGNMLSAMSIKS